MSTSSLLHAREIARSLTKRGRDNVWRQAPQIGIFMEPIDDSGSPASEVRVIEVTDEIRAQDAADRAAREAAHSSEVTWRRPEPVPERAYSFPAKRSNGKRRSTKRKVSATSTRPAPPAQPQPKPKAPRAPRRTAVTFKIGTPIHESKVPARRNLLSGRVSPMQPVYDALVKLQDTDTPWLPVTFEDAKDATKRASALRQLAQKRGFKLLVRSEENNLATMYFGIEKVEKQKEEAAA